MELGGGAVVISGGSRVCERIATRSRQRRIAANENLACAPLLVQISRSQS